MDFLTFALAVLTAKKKGGSEGEYLPTVTTDDNGKMLQVVDGEWSTVKITDGNEVAY